MADYSSDIYEENQELETVGPASYPRSAPRDTENTYANNYNRVIPNINKRQRDHITDNYRDKWRHSFGVYHLISGESVYLKAFMKKVSDSFDTKWNEETSYGRMDPIMKYSGTRRKASVTIDVPAYSKNDAIYNLAQLQILIKMQYPEYDDQGQRASTICSPPLLKVLLGNIILNSGGQPDGTARTSGLLCAMDGLKYEPDLDMGFFDPGKGYLYPKLFSLSFNLTILHTHSLGWKKNTSRWWMSNLYPYGVNDGTQEPPPGYKILDEDDTETYVSGEPQDIYRDLEDVNIGSMTTNDDEAGWGVRK